MIFLIRCRFTLQSFLSACFVFSLSYVDCTVTNRYVWIDWSSMPQPSACQSSTKEEDIDEMRKNLGNAVKTIPAYVNVSYSFP